MAGFDLIDTGGSVITVALHAGHEMRPSLRPWCSLDSSTRMREEDPYTDVIADVGASMLVAEESRFEVDLNRPREAAVYREPQDAWGLEVWRGPLPEAEVAESLALYDRFYAAAERLLGDAEAAHGMAVVLDVHSYNHRRAGADGAPEDPAASPDVNVGTGTLPAPWTPLAATVRMCFAERGFDARENVRFAGGHFAAWVHERFEGRVAVLALEFKKTFMDEWTGAVDVTALDRVRAALTACVPLAGEAVAEEVRRR